MRKNKASINGRGMYKAVVIGVSAGGLHALSKILPQLPSDYPLAVIIVQHRAKTQDNFLVEHFDQVSAIKVCEARPSQPILPQCVYFAPGGYHLLIEQEQTFSLSIDPPVNYAIPSIDVLFESAARCYRDCLIGIILTGANSDGSDGLVAVKKQGGLTLVQDPNTAENSVMPEAALNKVDVDYMMTLDDIGDFLANIILPGE